MTYTKLTAATIAALALSGCGEMDGSSGAASRAPAAVAIGETVSCIPRPDIHKFRIRDDYTIDFEMRDGTTYRNAVAGRCPTLGREERIAYSPTTARICSGDAFTVQNPAGKTTVPCNFGDFTPVRLSEN